MYHWQVSTAVGEYEQLYHETSLEFLTSKSWVYVDQIHVHAVILKEHHWISQFDHRYGWVYEEVISQKNRYVNFQQDRGWVYMYVERTWRPAGERGDSVTKRRRNACRRWCQGRRLLGPSGASQPASQGEPYCQDHQPHYSKRVRVHSTMYQPLTSHFTLLTLLSPIFFCTCYTYKTFTKSAVNLDYKLNSFF